MNILIVGAGAVGVVYGWHLKQAGHHVVFYTKAKYLDEVRAGLNLHRIGRRHSTEQHWSRPACTASSDDVRAANWDQVWLTVSSDAVRSPSMTPLLAAVGNATVICLQPDMEDIGPRAQPRDRPQPSRARHDPVYQLPVATAAYR